MASGALRIRGSAEPYALTNPTRITGTNTDGALSGVSFTTPAVTFVQAVENPPTTAEIEATFSQLAPGTGTVNDNGDVTVQVSLAVDLHIVVGILPEPSQCRAAPINLTLSSTAPYDPEAERVTLAAPNFSVPPVATSGTCTLVAGPVNESLAGSGHSLSLTLEGPLSLPTLGEPTATSLAVSPAGPVRMGSEVSLTATVVADPPMADAPPFSGQVAFFDGEEQLGLADVQGDGTATLVTTSLSAGSRQLSVRYLGAAPEWDPSRSPVVPYAVHADPGITTTLAGEIVRGTAPKGFDLTVINTGFGGKLDEDTQVTVTIRRATGFAPLDPADLTLRSDVDDTPTTVPLTLTGSTLTGVIGATGTWDLAPGEEALERLDLQAAVTMSPGPLRVTFALVVPGADPVTLATTEAETMVVPAVRTGTTLTAGDPGFPPWIPEVLPVTSVVRQGNVAELALLTISPEFAGVRPTGTLRFAVDGRPVLARRAGELSDAPWTSSVTASGSDDYLVRVPADIPTGTRLVTATYSGDALFAPSQASWPFTVEPSVGTIYDCRSQGITQGRFTANVEVLSSLGTVGAVGRELPVDRVEVRLRASRTRSHSELLTSVVDAGVDPTLELGLGPAGAVTPATVTRTDHTVMTTGDGLGIDSIIDLGEGAGTFPVDHAPGTTVDVTLATITATAVTGSGFLGGIVCTPDVDPHVVGSVTATGTTLTVDPGPVVGQGRAVTLAAAALPATPGVVEFRDGTTTIGVVPVDGEGKAVMSTRALPLGARSLTARFFGGVVSTLPSAAVELRVASCGAASESGNGAVVRLVFLELLGRCPDAGGYDYWVGRLDGGTSPEAFARSIARTSEAVGRVVDDAYQTMLGRPADAAGRAFWTKRLQASGRYDQLLADLAASGEFWSKAGSSNGGAVTRIYERLLERSPDQSGFDYWVARLGSGVSRRALVVTLANQSEPLGVLVDDAYDEILDRKPTATERTEGIVLLRSTGDRSGLYARLIGTQEFHDRAQGLPDPA